MAGASEPFKLYFLVGEPALAELRPAYESALSILGKVSIDREVFPESEAETLAQRIADEVAAHQQTDAGP